MAASEIILRSEGRRAIETGRLRELRVSSRLSQQDLARALGVTAACVSLWESGRRLPRGEVAERVAQLLRELERAVSVDAHE